jgi:hypothetical protein
MDHKDSGRLKAFALGVGLVVIGIACSKESDIANDHGNVLGPTLPSPSPEPSPSPSPTPTPLPDTSTTGVTVDVVQFGSQECKRGVSPTGDETLRVGCSVEVRLERKDGGGNDVPERRTGNTTEWHVVQGGSKVTLPWDENPWRRWLTGVAPGHYRIQATLTTKDHEQITGEIEGDVVE